MNENEFKKACLNILKRNHPELSDKIIAELVKDFFQRIETYINSIPLSTERVPNDAYEQGEIIITDWSKSIRSHYKTNLSEDDQMFYDDIGLESLDFNENGDTSVSNRIKQTITDFNFQMIGLIKILFEEKIMTEKQITNKIKFMTEERFQALNNHIGYGNSEASIVFLSLEEACSSDIIEIHNNHDYRQAYANGDNLYDLHDFHNAAPLYELNRWWIEEKTQPLWNSISYLVLEITGQENTPITRKNYYRNQLGRINGETCLLEYYPLPRPEHNFWDESFNTANYEVINGYFHFCRNNNNARISQISNIINGNNSSIVFLNGVLENGNKNGNRIENAILRADINDILPPPLNIDRIENIGNATVLIYTYENKTVICTYFLSTRNYSFNALQTLIDDYIL